MPDIVGRGIRPLKITVRQIAASASVEQLSISIFRYQMPWDILLEREYVVSAPSHELT